MQLVGATTLADNEMQLCCTTESSSPRPLAGSPTTARDAPSPTSLVERPIARSHSATEEGVYDGPLLRRSDGTVMKHGDNGTMVYSNGERYSGSWADDKPHGDGDYKSPDGMTYSGPWREGRFHGSYGECRYPNGDTYQGPWLNGLRHGGHQEHHPAVMGVMVWKEGPYAGYMYEGPWVNGTMHGVGWISAVEKGSGGSPPGQPQAATAAILGTKLTQYEFNHGVMMPGNLARKERQQTASTAAGEAGEPSFRDSHFRPINWATSSEDGSDQAWKEQAPAAPPPIGDITLGVDTASLLMDLSDSSDEEEEEEEYQTLQIAAVKIQASFRGHVDREVVQQKKGARQEWDLWAVVVEETVSAERGVEARLQLYLRRWRGWIDAVRVRCVRVQCRRSAKA